MIARMLKSWEKLCHSKSPSLVIHRFSEVVNHNQAVVSGTARRMFRDTRHYVIEATNSTRPDQWFVEGANNDYAFSLSRRDSAAEYFIRSVTPRTTADTNKSHWFDFRAKPFHWSQTLKVHRHIVWPNVFLSSSLKIRELKEVLLDGKSCLKMHFDIDPSADEFQADQDGSLFNALPKISDGVALFWVDHDFVPLTFSGTYQMFKDPASFELSYSVEYELLNNVPLPVRRTTSILAYQGDEQLMIADSYEYPEGLSILPASRFRLSGFNLPEPNMGKSGTPVWLIISIAAVLSVGLLIVFRRRNRTF